MASSRGLRDGSASISAICRLRSKTGRGGGSGTFSPVAAGDVVGTGAGRSSDAPLKDGILPYGYWSSCSCRLFGKLAKKFLATAGAPVPDVGVATAAAVAP